MALTYTPHLNMKQKCPDFSVLGLDGKTYDLEHFNDQLVLIFLFICNHCPYVKAIEDRIISLAADPEINGAQIIGVCSNDSSDFPEDSFESLKAQWASKNYGFPYLFDEDQSMAKSFGAVCTPDIFVFNQDRNLTYRGRLDDSWKSPEKVERQDLKLAILSALNGSKLPFEPVPSMGCSIKWKTND